MKNFVIRLVFIATCFLAADVSLAQDQELKAWVGKIQQKLNRGETTPANLEPEIQEGKQLIASKKDSVPEEAAEAQVLLAMLHVQVFNDLKTGMEILEATARDFQGTKVAKHLPEMQENLRAAAKAQEARANLAVGKTFPNFSGTDVDGRQFSLEEHKGKVVLIDFWATWCGPCVQELPHVKATYEAFRDKDFDIIGISLDEEKDALLSFLKTHDIPWKQHFDGKGWESTLATQFGIQSIPATFLLDKSGTIIGTDLRGDELKKAVAKAVAN